MPINPAEKKVDQELKEIKSNLKNYEYQTNEVSICLSFSFIEIGKESCVTKRKEIQHVKQKRINADLFWRLCFLLAYFCSFLQFRFFFLNINFSRNYFHFKINNNNDNNKHDKNLDIFS